MAHTQQLAALREGARPKSAKAWMLAAALACAAGSAAAQDTAAPSLATLERGFWACDYQASTTGVDPATGARCAELTGTLKQRKFSGDFTAMLAWWREHKDREHLALAAGPQAGETLMAVRP